MTEDPEIAAMAKIANALADLDAETQGRVIEWAAKKYGVAVSSSSKLPRQIGTGTKEAVSFDEGGGYDAFVDLFDHANPKTESERALVGGYWFQEISGQPSFDAQSVNNALKDVGHGIQNITQALNALQNRKPALVRQMAKSGRTKQARKTYKLTTAGCTEVARLRAGTPSEE